MSVAFARASQRWINSNQQQAMLRHQASRRRVRRKRTGHRPRCARRLQRLAAGRVDGRKQYEAIKLGDGEFLSRIQSIQFAGPLGAFAWLGFVVTFSSAACLSRRRLTAGGLAACLRCRFRIAQPRAGRSLQRAAAPQRRPQADGHGEHNAHSGGAREHQSIVGNQLPRDKPPSRQRLLFIACG